MSATIQDGFWQHRLASSHLSPSYDILPYNYNTNSKNICSSNPTPHTAMFTRVQLIRRPQRRAGILLLVLAGVAAPTSASATATPPLTPPPPTLAAEAVAAAAAAVSAVPSRFAPTQLQDQGLATAIAGWRWTHAAKSASAQHAYSGGGQPPRGHERRHEMGEGVELCCGLGLCPRDHAGEWKLQRGAVKLLHMLLMYSGDFVGSVCFVQ